MKAVCWMGKKDVQVLDVPDPKILNRRDAIVKVTSTAIRQDRERARRREGPVPVRHPPDRVHGRREL